MSVHHFTGAAVCALLAAGSAFAPASAQSYRDLSGFRLSTLERGDDNFSGETALGFTANFYGQSFSSLHVNNNGNLGFGSGSADYSPRPLDQVAYRMIAPYWDDIDTRPANGGTVRYGTGTVNGRTAFIASWDRVGYYNQGTDRTNTFQVVLIDRSDIQSGAFDVEVNYQQIQFNLNNARVGFTDGQLATGVSVELPGSGTPGAFLDSNTLTALISQTNVGVPGRYVLEVRNGVVTIVAVETPQQASAAAQEEAFEDSAPAELRSTVRSLVSTINGRLRQLRGGTASFNTANAMGGNSSVIPLDGLAAGESTNAIGVWVDYTHSRFRNVGSSDPFQGHGNTMLAGLDYAVTPKLVVGAAVGFDQSHVSNSNVDTLRRGRGGSGTLYAGYMITDWLQATAHISGASVFNEIDRTAGGTDITGDTRSFRYVASTSLTASQTYDQFTVSGTLGYNRSREGFNSYTSSDGATVNPDTVLLGQVTLGSEVSYTFTGGQAYVNATWEWDHIGGSGDRNGAVLGTGVLFQVQDNFNVGLAASAQVLRRDERQYTLGANARYTF